MQSDSAFIKQRALQLYHADVAVMRRRTDRMFALLLVLQWLGCIAWAAWASPGVWGSWRPAYPAGIAVAALIEGLIVAAPLFLVLRRPGVPSTRYVVAVAQMLTSGFMIHLSSGRAETHFHIFGSLAFLALYRDWRVILAASGVAAVEECALSYLWLPAWLGMAGSQWRALERVLWIAFEDVFLIYACVQRRREAVVIAERQAELEESRGSVEREVNERTAQLAQSNRDLARQIGERQRAENELRTARDEAESNVRERTAELAAANRALKRQIDEGRRTEQELARSIQRYRFVTDSLPQMVWTARPDGSIDYFNRRFHEYTGLTVEQSVDWGWKPAIHPDDVERFMECWLRCVSTGAVFELEHRLRRGTDGSYRWHLTRAIPMRDADEMVVQWLATSTDVDEQKRNRETIRRSEQRYRSLVSATAQIVWVTDAECRVVDDLPEWRAATGQTFEEITNYGWMQAIHPDDLAQATAKWRAALESKLPYENENRLRMADGSYRYFNVRGVPVTETDGRVREWIGACTDITERKQAEDVLRRAHDELEARVRERTAQLTETNLILHEQVIERKRIEGELAEARDEALNSARLKSQFLANMSHEIRTPMNGVIGMTSLLMDTQLDDEQREYLETIRASGDSLLSIINDILDFSKIEAGKLEIEQLDFDLQTTVESVVELLAENAAAKKLDLACHVLEDVPRELRGDPGRLRQILVNLVGNAVKFTPSGRVLVHVAKLQESATDAQICFQISDTGIGLSEEAARSLFQPFVQADGSMTRKFGGTGLGLAICKQLVEMMGGQIGVESAPEQGSTFWFTVRLPKQPTFLADEDAVPEAPTDFSAGRAVLLGGEGTCGILREQLTAWGMPSKTFTTAPPALAALRESADSSKAYGFVLVDATAPDVDGPAIVREIASDPKLKAVRAVLLLAPGQRVSAEDRQLCACLNKPVKRSQLRDYFRNALAVDAQQKPKKESVAAVVAPTPIKRAGRTHVLIVEDNQVNQKVIIRQLQKIGCKADAVANGLEALEASGNVAYDCILMDCQMPEMDGFEATREIRQRERTTGTRTPIVALTANALEGDRGRCLEAGMDDYLSKPVKMEELQAMLERWALPKKEAELEHAAAA